MAGNQAQFNENMSRGHSAAWELEWDRAAAYYHQALTEFPDDTKVLSHLATALFELQEYDKAMYYYRKVAEASPGDPLPLEKIAQILEHQGKLAPGAEVALRAAELHLKQKDINKAIENWTRSIILDPENLQARTRLALVYERTGRKPQAVTQYLAVASLMQHAGHKERAIELVQHAANLVPTSNEARQAIGLLRANQLLPKPARKTSRMGGALVGRKPLDTPQLEAARKRESTNDPVSEAGKKALAALAGLMFEQPEEYPAGEGEGRRSLMAIAMGTGPLSQARVERSQIILHLSQAVDLQARKQFDRAADELDHAIDAGLNNAAAYFDLGLLRARSGRLESAMQNLQHAVGHPDYAMAAHILLGQTFRKVDRLRDGSTQFLEALKLADSMVVEKEQAVGIRQLYEPIIEAHSRETDDDVHSKLCNSIERLLMRPDWQSQLIQARRQLPRSSPDAPPAPLAELLTQTQSSRVVEILGNVHQMARNGFHRMAMEEAFRAIQYAPTYLPLHTFMGEILLQQDHIPEAITKFNVVSRAYSIRGESTRAIDLLRKITRLSPLDLSARQRLIEQLTASGQVEATIREYLDLGDVYYRLAELDKARDTYKKALNVAQHSGMARWTAEILHHLADIDLQRLDWRRALRLFRQIHSLNPGDQKAATHIIDLNFRMGKETEALTVLGNFVEHLNRNGREQDALHTLEDLLQNDPERVAIQRTLAEQYEKTGRIEDAIAQWDEVGERLLNVNDKFGAVQAIRSILKLNPPNAADYKILLMKLEGGD